MREILDCMSHTLPRMALSSVPAGSFNIQTHSTSNVEGTDVDGNSHRMLPLGDMKRTSV